MALLTSKLDHWASSLGFADFVKANRVTVGFVDQVTSHLLGMVHVLTLCKMINLSSRVYFAMRVVSLDSIQFVNAICEVRFDRSLPILHGFASLDFVVVTLVPAALWAGAITPIISCRNTTSQILVSQLGQFDPNQNSQEVYAEKGLFTYIPDLKLPALLLNSASQASSQTNGTAVHAKLDVTGYSYLNRSYGVGGSAGLTNNHFESATSYSYHELGFKAHTSCVCNESSAFTMGEGLQVSGRDSGTALYVAEGTLINGANATQGLSHLEWTTISGQM